MDKKPDNFVFPTQRNISRVLSGAMEAVGLASFCPDDKEILNFPNAKAAVVVLVDGLGSNLIDRYSGYTRFIRRLDEHKPLTSVVPSTTAAAITSLGTGLMPGEHAVVSYSLKTPHSYKNFSLIQWDDPRVDPRSWQKHDTLAERLGRTANDTVVIQPPSYVNSGLSLCALRSMPSACATYPHERVEETLKQIKNGKKLIYLYWGDVDKAGHAYGVGSLQWLNVLEECDSSIEQLRSLLPHDVLLILTADHGMINVGNRWDVAQESLLSCDVDLISGEERAVHIYTSQPRHVIERWKEFFQEKVWMLTREDAFSSGLFGHKYSDFSMRVSGDVIAFFTDDTCVVDNRTRIVHGKNYMVGVHGSLTSDEMLIPLYTYMG
ncbi:MAG: alkaline phosphatase family protein [Actinomycetaceae bacterium]|nr:alkaline phosphatase family protein [Actinomycetaceae bacterium]